MFYDCNNLASLDVSNWNTSKVTSMNHLFELCKSLTCLDLRSFDTSSVTSMYYMFANCPKLTSIDISAFVINENTNIGQYFVNTNNLKYVKCNNINTLNRLNALLPAKSSDNQGTIICKSGTTNLDTTTLQSINWTINTNPTLIAKYKYDSKIYKNLIPVFNYGYMGFVEDEEVDVNGVVTRVIEHVELPIGINFGVSDNGEHYTNRSDSLLAIYNLDTSAIVDGSRMVKGCRYMTEINTSDWDTSNMVDMLGMFGYCTNLTSLDLSNFNTKNVTNMTAMFYNCNNLTSLDLSNWDTKNVTNMQQMFDYCSNLTSLDLSNFNTSNVTYMEYMFYNCNKLT